MEKISLFIDDSEESKLAEKILKENEISFIRKDAGEKEVIDFVGYKGLFEGYSAYPVFANSLREPLVPSLFYEEKNGDKKAYLSLSGVKAYLRYQLAKDFSKMDLLRKDIETFYGSGKEVTCFDENKEKIFEGSIDKAPHNFKNVLARHAFLSWHEVGSKDLGNLEEICTKVNDKGIILNPEKNLVLFSEEVDLLKKGDSIILRDVRSMYEVSFDALYSNNGNLFKLTAYMLD